MNTFLLFFGVSVDAAGDADLDVGDCFKLAGESVCDFLAVVDVTFRLSLGTLTAIQSPVLSAKEDSSVVFDFSLSTR